MASSTTFPQELNLGQLVLEARMLKIVLRCPFHRVKLGLTIRLLYLANNPVNPVTTFVETFKQLHEEDCNDVFQVNSNNNNNKKEMQ